MRVQALNKEHLDLYWNQIEDLLAKGLFYSEGEMNIHQLRMMIVQGTAHVAVGIDDEDVIRGALAFQIVAYPNIRTAHIISYGGYDLFASEADFEQLLVGLRKAGVTRLDGWCKPAQARLFKSKYGFDTPYQMVSLTITK